MKKKIWIDLDNSPHVVFFRPIIKALQQQGHEIFLTARDTYQVYGLADYFNLRPKRVGRHYGKNKILKVLGTLIRTIKLIPILLNEKPVLAVSHGSRAQILSAKILGIPSIVIFDYEHAKGLIVIHPTWSMAPEVVVDDLKTHNKKHLLKYPGIKEDVYVPDFKPDPAIKKDLGINDKDLIVTIRPPATEAHYHNPQSDKLLEAVIDLLDQTPDVRMILLPRNERQNVILKESFQEMIRKGKMLIPDHVIDGLNIIWYSDLVISGGGTMNREAAALGVPVYSIFRGKIGAVDRYLAKNGRLTLLESVDDVRKKIKLTRRNKTNKMESTNTASLDKVVKEIVTILQ